MSFHVKSIVYVKLESTNQMTTDAVGEHARGSVDLRMFQLGFCGGRCHRSSCRWFVRAGGGRVVRVLHLLLFV